MLVACSGIFPARAALAADSGNTESEAEQALEQATGAFALGQFSEAAAAYERAFRLHPDAALLYNAAQSHRMAGEKARALELYRSYVRVYRRGPNRAEAARHVEILEKQLQMDDGQARPAPAAAAPAVLTPPPAATPAAAPPDLAPRALPAAVLATRPAPVEDRRPLTSKPWFWVTVVGGLALVAAGVVVGVTLSGTSSARADRTL